MTKWRGQLLFEMQAATVVLAQRALDEGKLTRFQAQVYYMILFHAKKDFYTLNKYRSYLLTFNIFRHQEVFEEALEHLREAIGILQVEPDEKEGLQEQMKNLSRILTELDDDEEEESEIPELIL